MKGGNLPVITCKTYKANEKSNDVRLVDKDGNEIARVVYSPDKPLECGAKVWIETDSKHVRMV